MDLPTNKIVCGSALEVLKTLPAGSINCCITSPPYWALRDYGVAGQLGLEPTFEEYISKLCDIYDEVKRVLRKDGTCFVNLGDTYAGGNSGGYSNKSTLMGYTGEHTKGRIMEGKTFKVLKSTPDKSLCLIPQRFAIEMVNRGWILRNVIIWHKPNPMPSSAKDRYTVDFEYVYFFVKSKKYYFEPQHEPYLTESNADRPRMGQGQNTQYEQKRKEVYTGQDTKDYALAKAQSPSDSKRRILESIQSNPLGRNKRTVWQIGKKYQVEVRDENGVLFGGSGELPEAMIKQIYDALAQTKTQDKIKNTVWTIPTQPFSEAHFATFPEKLIEPMILAGCPEFVCKKCGKARVKIYDSNSLNDKKQWPTGWGSRGYKGEKHIGSHTHDITERNFKGYTDCGCNAGWRPGIVLDPFMGSGTTGLVAARNRRDWLGIELKPEYIKMAKQRIATAETGVPVKEQKAGQMGLFE